MAHPMVNHVNYIDISAPLLNAISGYIWRTTLPNETMHHKYSAPLFIESSLPAWSDIMDRNDADATLEF